MRSNGDFYKTAEKKLHEINKGFVEEQKVHPNQKVVKFDEMGNII